MLQDTIQCNEPQLHGPAIENCYRAHHNRTNLSHFNLVTITEAVFATFGFDTPKRIDCPSQELLVVPFRYVNVALYQLYMSEHAKGTSHSFMYGSL